MTRHFLRDDDLSPAEQAEVLALAADLKRAPYDTKSLAGPRTVSMIFDKQTLRTQASFSAGIAELGGFPMLVDGSLAGIGVRESIPDVARVLGRQASMIVWRTSGQERIETMAEHAGVPVVNALTDEFHPCQLLADLQTVQERLGPLAGVTATFLGDGSSNMAHSWLLAGATAGMHVRISGPDGFHPSADIVDAATARATATGGSVTVEADPTTASTGADVLVTDTWVSMGRESESDQRLGALPSYSLTQELLDLAAPGAIAMHCLPAYRGKEIAAEVIDGPRSVVWDEAENRRHAQKAILTWLLQQEGSP